MLKSIIVFLFLSIPFSSLYSQEAGLDHFIKDYINLNCKQNLQLLYKNKSLNYFKDFIIQPKPGDRNSLVIDSIIISSTLNFKDKITVKYTEAGFVSSFKDYYFQNDQWFLNSRTSYEYNQHGNIILSIYEDWNDSNWAKVTREDYTYDTHSNIILHIIKNWVDENWKNSLKLSTTYNSIGDSSITITEKWDGNSKWNKFSKITTYYFPNKIRASVSFEFFSNNHWQPYILSSFNYNDNWILVSLLHKKWNGSSFENWARVTFNYSVNKPQVILQLVKSWNNGKWGNYSRNYYLYNSENYFKDGLYEEWENNQWVSADGIINILNPDGFELHYFTNEAVAYYESTTDVDNNNDIHLNAYRVQQNYPNPFNPSTTIKYQIPKEGFVTLKVYDMLGRDVATLVNQNQESGKYTVNFNASNLPSGIYIYKIKAGDFTKSKKMLLLK